VPYRSALSWSSSSQVEDWTGLEARISSSASLWRHRLSQSFFSANPVPNTVSTIYCVPFTLHYHIHSIYYLQVSYRITNTLPSCVTGNAVVCYCDGQCPDNAPNGTCTAPQGGKCFTSTEGIYNPDTGQMELEYTYGCFPGDERGLMQCRSSNHPGGKAILCCDYMDMCNKALTPQYKPVTTTPPPGMSYDDSIHYIALIISITVCLIAFLVIVAYYYLRYKKREDIRLLSLSQSVR